VVLSSHSFIEKTEQYTVEKMAFIQFLQLQVQKSKQTDRVGAVQCHGGGGRGRVVGGLMRLSTTSVPWATSRGASGP
jgi:hypothetical protein